MIEIEKKNKKSEAHIKISYLAPFKWWGIMYNFDFSYTIPCRKIIHPNLNFTCETKHVGISFSLSNLNPFAISKTSLRTLHSLSSNTPLLAAKNSNLIFLHIKVLENWTKFFSVKLINVQSATFLPEYILVKFKSSSLTVIS